MLMETRNAQHIKTAKIILKGACHYPRRLDTEKGIIARNSPFWLQRRAPFPCRKTSCYYAPAHLTRFSTNTYQHGRHRLVRHRPGILADRTLIESSLFEPSQRPRFLAAQAPHSGDCLLALLIAACALTKKQCE